MKVALTPNEFDRFTKYIIQNWGIDLDDSKRSLLETRLGSLLNKYQCPSYDDLYHQAKKNQKIASEVINAISTNETSFFREEPVFELIKNKLIPTCLRGKQRVVSPCQENSSLQIWSAACSTGQEAYTLAILLKELDPSATFNNYQITATDISDKVLKQAKEGVYTQKEVEKGLNTERLNQFFHSYDTECDVYQESLTPLLNYQANDDVRSLIQFQHLNLTTFLPYRFQFDIVLCRNVTIYFNIEMKRIVYDRIANTMKPDGFLILGSAENLFEISDRFERRKENEGFPHGILYYQLIK